jgi:hypothetical protein
MSEYPACRVLQASALYINCLLLVDAMELGLRHAGQRAATPPSRHHFCLSAVFPLEIAHSRFIRVAGELISSFVILQPT